MGCFWWARGCEWELGEGRDEARGRSVAVLVARWGKPPLVRLNVRRLLGAMAFDGGYLHCTVER